MEIRFAAAYAEKQEMEVTVSKLKITAFKISFSYDHLIYILLLRKSVGSELLNLIHFSAKLGNLICEKGSASSAFINTSPLLLF